MGLLKRPTPSGQSHVTTSQLVSCVVYLLIIADWEEEASSSRYSLSSVPKSAPLTLRDTVPGNIKVTTDLHMEASSSEVVTSSTATHGGTNESAFTYSHPNNDVTTDSPTTETLSSEGIVTSTISFEGSSASTATRKLDDNDVTTAPPMESSSSDGMMTSTVSVHEPTSDVTTDLHMEASSSEVVTSSTATHGGTDESAFTYSHPNNDVTTDSPTTETLSSEGIVTSTISFEGSSASTATRKLDDNDVTTAPPIESFSSDGMMTSTVSVHEPTSDVTEKGTAPSVCDGGWMSSESSSYMYISEKLSQTEAGARCAANGGHLVYVETLEENNTIKDMVAMCEEYWNRRAYIGLTDETIEGEYKLKIHFFFPS
ncbi:hypothetical protein BSL78_25484 [Apostichopus japonicus]|uniref:C-type lectin domain-containing protein n=1 Tax=Stichopus japonicus TaxID=307972 RepID=A0A2G8JPI2_STIJA|nr:hypothetical protein BSL78_25484 [Apostichopus japonicus]